MSTVSFSFNLSAIPSVYQADFMARLYQLSFEYQTLTNPAPISPPAESVPLPSAFVAVDGDGADGEVAPAVKNPYRGKTGQQLRDLLADRMGLPADHAQRRNTPKFPKKADLVAELCRLDAVGTVEDTTAERRMSDDSLTVPTEEPAPAPAPAPAESVVDGGSETSSKKPRKSGWANYTPEQRQARIDKMKASRAATMARLASTDALMEALVSGTVATDV